MKAAHSRSRTTIAVVLCSALLVLSGIGAALAQTPPTAYGSEFFEHALETLSERVSLPSLLNQHGAPTGFHSARSAFSGYPTSPYGVLDTGTWQGERKHLSRSPPSLDDSISPPIASSFPPAEASRVQTPINEPNKLAADSGANRVAAQSPDVRVSLAQTAMPDVVAPASQGISDKEIRFGIVAPFSGSAKELGRQMKFGIETVFSLVNDAGGINGRLLKLFSADDGYEPSRTGEAMNQLWKGDHVFGMVGNVGTPTAVVALPFALDHKMLFFGAFTGANLLRQVPPDHYVFNYRASYSEETEVQSQVFGLTRAHIIRRRGLIVLVMRATRFFDGKSGCELDRLLSFSTPPRCG